MRIVTFLFPGPADRAVGGYKVAFEYANRLALQGDTVHLVFPSTLLWNERSVWEKIASSTRYVYSSIFPSTYKPDAWFILHPNIQLHWTPSLEEKHIPDADVVFATSCETAEYVVRYNPSKGVKCYLIQHFEAWYFDKERVLNTWRAPLHKIVIAPWLEAIATQEHQEVTLIHNGLDFERFGLERPIEERNPYRVAMLYHTLKWKGCEVAIEALKQVKMSKPQLEVRMFGTPPKPKLPDWIVYDRSPPQEKLKSIYNDASVFLSASFGEGWGLTIPEAMQCGCAVVCTQVDGHDVAMHRHTALTSDVANPEQLAQHMIEMFENQELRIKLAKAGHQHVQQFTWERAFTALEQFLAQVQSK